MIVVTVIDAAFVFQGELLALLLTMLSRLRGRFYASQANKNKFYAPPQMDLAGSYSYTLKMCVLQVHICVHACVYMWGCACVCLRGVGVYWLQSPCWLR